MNEDFHLIPLAADADAADLLEALGPLEERPPESQYCVFRSGRERFCFPVLDVEDALVSWSASRIGQGRLARFRRTIPCEGLAPVSPDRSRYPNQLERRLERR